MLSMVETVLWKNSPVVTSGFKFRFGFNETEVQTEEKSVQVDEH